MKILITGGAGFVGSELMSYLRYRNDISAVLDVEIDPAFNVCDEATLANVLPHYDTIVHLAAIVGEPACIIDPQLAYNINVGAVRKLVKHMSLSQRLIFMSSASVYGNRPGELVDENTTPLPTNNYARQKYEAEEVVKNNLRNYIVFRPVTAFGVSKRIRLDLLVNTLIYEALTTGKINVFEPSVVRPMIHVTDFARFIVHAIDNKMKWGEIYNIGDPALTVTKDVIAQRIGTLCGASLQYSHADSLDLRDYDISFNRIMHVYGASFTTGSIVLNRCSYMAQPFEFTKRPLELAVHQIKSRLDEIKKDPGKYNTPEKTRILYDKHKAILN